MTLVEIHQKAHELAKLAEENGFKFVWFVIESDIEDDNDVTILPAL